MKVKFSHLLPCLLLTMMTWATAAFAQDDMPGPSTNNIFNQNDPQVYDEKPLLLEQDNRFRPSSQRDSVEHLRNVIVPSSKPKVGADPKKAKEDDPLNFNFLYYIIRNFKSTDLME